jgi:DNA-binding NarL/FixJ family response regulator
MPTVPRPVVFTLPMKEPFNIVIGEGITIFREAVKSLLSSQPDLKVVGEAADGFEAIRSAQIHSPDLVLMDLSMSGMAGLDAIREIKQVNPQSKILAPTALTVHSTEEYVLATLRAGVNGLVLKEVDGTELLKAVHQVMEGRYYLSPSLFSMILDGLLEDGKEPAIRYGWSNLSIREKQIVKLIAEGHISKAIAQTCGISVRTVERHRLNIMKKLGVHNAASLTALALEKGLIRK